MTNRTDLVPASAWEPLRCGCCHAGQVHTWAAHIRALEVYERAQDRQRYNNYWLCLCGRVQPPEIEWCTGCYCKRHQGADILAAVVDGLAKDLDLPMGVIEAEGGA